MINQQKIYIDIDEEITTVVDRIHRIEGNNIILIVPQHALLLQSIVNLKLLAQEAKRYKKNIVLMTRDEDGIVFAQRAGIEVQPFVTQEDEGEMIMSNKVHSDKKIIPKYAEQIIKEESRKKTNMNLGSRSFFDTNTSMTNVSGVHASLHNSVNDQVENTKHAVTLQKQGTRVHVKQQMRQKHLVQNAHDKNMIQRHVAKNEVVKNNTVLQKRQSTDQTKGQLFQVQNNIEHLDEYEQSLRNAQLSNKPMGNIQLPKDENLQHIYAHPKKTRNIKRNIIKKQRNKRKPDSVNLSSVTGTIIRSFIFGGIILGVFILFIVILPKTKISVTPKHININEKIELTAQTDQSVYDSERRLIPARLIERDITFTKTFDATGHGDVKAQKAHGKITIINEYSDKPQPLVATTRFLAEDGTLFRLANHVTVPGMKDGKPGKIEVLVIADKSGSNANIGPTKFSIPGFKGTPKDGKFYAVSEKAMIGGGIGGNNVIVTTDADIEKAKKEMTDEIKQYITEQVTGLLRPDNEVLLDDDIKYEVISSEASVSAGTMTNQFMYEIVSHVKVLVFSEDDVLAVMNTHLAKKYHQYDADKVNLDIRYTDIVPDFDKESIKMTVQGVADVIANVNLDLFKKNIIGKKHEEILKIMEDDYNSEIEKVTIESVFPGFPGFIANHVSRFGFMTSVFIK